MGIEATPVIQPSETDVECADQDLVREVTEFQDGCPVMPKINAHVVSRGQCATIEKTFRDRNGNPIDLVSCTLGSSGSESESENAPANGVKVRFMEIIGLKTEVFEADATVVDSQGGVVRAVLPAALVENPGVYVEEWGVFDDGILVFTNRSYLFVEAGLFGFPGTTTSISDRNMGPPTLTEIRLSIRDNAPSENVLLEDVEFSDVEIAYAVARPIRQFNDYPPPLSVLFSTTTFPWKEHWLKAIQGFLYDTAAAWYRRNRLGTSAGGVQVDDLNKFREYEQASRTVMEQWERFLLMKKVEINATDFVSVIGSTYGRSY
jgi:hypothetical protein